MLRCWLGSSAVSYPADAVLSTGASAKFTTERSKGVQSLARSSCQRQESNNPAADPRESGQNKG